jgi:hypothetical protein
MSSADELLKRLDEPTAPAWRAEKPEDVIAGVVRGTSSYDGGYGEYPIVTVEAEVAISNGAALTDPQLAIHGLGTVLADRLRQLNPKVGGRIAVRFNGEKQSKGGNTYKDWSVAYDPPAPGADIIEKLNDDKGLFGS